MQSPYYLVVADEWDDPEEASTLGYAQLKSSQATAEIAQATTTTLSMSEAESAGTEGEHRKPNDSEDEAESGDEAEGEENMSRDS